MYTYNKNDKSYTFSSDELDLDNLVNLENNSNSENNLVDDSNPEEIKNKNKKIEVINGGNDLNISPVSNYIEIEKPKNTKRENIVIPEDKKEQ